MWDSKLHLKTPIPFHPNPLYILFYLVESFCYFHSSLLRDVKDTQSTGLKGICGYVDLFIEGCVQSTSKFQCMNELKLSQGPWVIVAVPMDSGKITLSRMLLSWASK
ncbi:uncharacterized protein LOC111377464 isoform X3 [Olea europaea var. sylvestris]|uniref:uncharacterized protein LOC111377464 isoform X3 n=1 Tax=Olea europaea var. sylvestris TaxID=158386 RepID=UPI000C1D129C|nr:uncharacterized protein LOC111377464 isoform X3 [Olea europaea var. sylvestris]